MYQHYYVIIIALKPNIQSKDGIAGSVPLLVSTCNRNMFPLFQCDWYV